MNGEHVETMPVPEPDLSHTKQDREMRTHEAVPRISKVYIKAYLNGHAFTD